jgi:hypothetical protein
VPVAPRSPGVSVALPLGRALPSPAPLWPRLVVAGVRPPATRGHHQAIAKAQAQLAGGKPQRGGKQQQQQRGSNRKQQQQRGGKKKQPLQPSSSKNGNAAGKPRPRGGKAQGKSDRSAGKRRGGGRGA